MYIAPNSNIRILRNVPLEPDYINTLYFSTVADQTNYFLGTTKYNLTQQSYQRVNKGICRVNHKPEDLYDCNYLMFQNTSFGSKWFYAFINKVEYVNNVTSDVYYEIDVMQTWAFDYTLTQCLIEREHSTTDAIGDNIVPEPVDVGEMVFNYYEKIDEELDEYAIILACLNFPESEDNRGRDAYHVYTGYQLVAFELSTEGVLALNGALTDFYTQKPDEVLSIYMCPIWCLPSDDFGENHWYIIDEEDTNCPAQIRPKFTTSTEKRDRYKINIGDTIDGYTPKNNKLYTYPYNFFHIDNANGRELNTRFEFFHNEQGQRDLSPKFYIHCMPVMPVTVVLRPFDYKGVTSQELCSESIDLTGYPMCAWNVDSYNAWLAQNSIPESMSILNKAGGVTTDIARTSIASELITGSKAISKATKGMAMKELAGITIGATILGTALELSQNRYKASIQADICRGSLNNSNVNFSSHKQNFFCGRVSVNRYTAKIIDDFFNRFGYATNTVKVPNTHSRPHWNYVKTVGSNVGGNIPADDKHDIDAIFNNGITFWKNPANVDNYSLNNAPT